MKLLEFKNLKRTLFDLQQVTEERTIIQFHYTEWHSHTNPFGNAVLEFRRRVRAVVGSTLKDETGPMVVHCKSVEFSSNKIYSLTLLALNIEIFIGS